MKNRALTERKLLDAVAYIVKNRGFAALGVNKIAKQAGVSKILIYRYFGSYDLLLKACVREKDFWSNHISKLPVMDYTSESLQEQVRDLLIAQFSDFYEHCEMEASIVDSFGDESTITNTLSNNKRHVEADTDNDRIITKLLIAGTEQMIRQIRQKENDGTEVTPKPEQKDLMRSMEHILQVAFA